MPTYTHASAIIRWREQLDQDGGALGGFAKSATVSTMLFGCNSWLDAYRSSSPADLVTRIETIKSELEFWMSENGLEFTG